MVRLGFSAEISICAGVLHLKQMDCRTTHLTETAGNGVSMPTFDANFLHPPQKSWKIACKYVVNALNTHGKDTPPPPPPTRVDIEGEGWNIKSLSGQCSSMTQRRAGGKARKLDDGVGCQMK